MSEGTAAPAATKQPANLDVQVLIAGRWGGKVIHANTDYATGGPLHPETEKQAAAIQQAAKDKRRKPPENLPNASERLDDHRCVGDIIQLPFSDAVAGMQQGRYGIPDAVAEANPDATRAFMAAVFAKERPATYPPYPKAKAA